MAEPLSEHSYPDQEHLEWLLRRAEADVVEPPPSAELLCSLAADSLDKTEFDPIRRVLDAFLADSGLAMALISNSGKVLVAVNWQNVCGRFFREHPETRKLCEETDSVARAAMIESAERGDLLHPTPRDYRCGNGLREIAQPLVTKGVSWATIYIGQFLYEGEEPDEAELAAQARSHGWDEGAFIQAWRSVPRVSARKAESVLAFCAAFSDFVSRLEYSAYRERQLAFHYFQTERSLSEALEQKDLLFLEFQHRVKNSLTLIASLLSLESASFGDERLRVAFEEAQGRIRSVALLYERLYRTRSVERIDLGAYVAETASSAMESLSGSGASIRVESDCIRQEIDTRRAVYVGLVVHELAANALKHAFPAGADGRFRVSLQLEGKDLILTASDDGIGLPEGFSLEGSGSLGLVIITNLAKQLGGSLEAGSGIGSGSRLGASFRLRFPL